MNGGIGFSAVLGSIFIILYAITIIGLVSLILLENRNPLKTIPWVIVLILLPGIGLIFYYFLGRDHYRLRIITRRLHKRFRKQVPVYRLPDNIGKIPPNYLPLAQLLNRSNYSAIFCGSNISVYTKGTDKFGALLEDIKNAQHYIHFQYYIFSDDRIGHEVRNALTAKAREGVKIRVMYDDVGCWDINKRFFEDMKKDGIEVYPFLKVVFPILTSKVNYRNHRKIVVIDGKIGYMGGMNVADRYFEGNKLGPWRDSHFRITGPGVYGLQSSFLIDWYTASNRLLKGKEFYPGTELCSDMKMQIVMSGPTSPWYTLMQAFLFCISNAKKYIYIQTPYFLPTESLNQALQMASLGGIDVRLMIPKRSDTRSAKMATFSYIDKMLSAGVKVYLYDKGFLHSKLLLTDDMLTCFGSANFDFRSFEHNFEINAFVYQRNFAVEMKKIFLQDIRDCDEITYAAWRKRPITRRLAESFMRLFAPLL
ncbi:MAG: cardiolipin synthase [Tannerella sp.]|nr:cardiolipin synthase [Tannerella sp.]